MLAASLGFLTGCQTVDSRIKEKPDVFAQLDPATKDKVKQGIIELGYSEDVVYLALGTPDQKRESVSATGKSITWIYNTYYNRYDGGFYAGYHRSVYFDPYLRAYRMYYRPVLASKLYRHRPPNNLTNFSATSDVLLIWVLACA